MAHYAILDENNIVINVIVGRNEDEIVDGISDWETHYSQVTGKRVLRTSRNTKGNVHVQGKEPFRGNYAIIGGYYDEENDVFIEPSPFPSWVLDENYVWQAPVPYPSRLWDEQPTLDTAEGREKIDFLRRTYWDEESQQWLQKEVN